MNEDLNRRTQLQEQSSMMHWWPRLEPLDVPTPETVRIPAEKRPVMDGSMQLALPDHDDITDAVRQVGGPPAFLRSDQMSSKHNMIMGSKLIGHNADGKWTLGGLIEQHLGGFGTPSPSCYYVREWLDLWHKFKSFAEGATPIAAEVRTFIHDGEYHDAAFYWPEDAIWGHAATEDNWRKLLRETKQTALGGEGIWRPLTKTVAAEFSEGYWSVDFALAEGGTWYCIDMARGEVSWHPDGIERLESVEP